MGEQTQPQQLPQPQPEPQLQPQIEPPVQILPLNGPADFAAAVDPQPIASPPAKIPPSRPRKARKLFPDDSAATATDPNSSQLASPPAVNPKTTTKSAKPKTPQPRALVVAAPRIVARSLSCPGEVENAIRHLRNADPLLASLIDLHPAPTFDTFHTPFLALTRSILYQQLAFKAGTSIYTRFISLCGGEAGVVPDTVLALTPQQLRQIGVSGRKASYLHDLARKYHNGILSDSAIVNMDDRSLFTMLTMVNGIGSWSVHMFMIFSLHRPDVLPVNDLGVRKGVQFLYNLEELPRPSQMDQLCEKWRPYRSVASWYLWRFVEAKGSPSSAVAVATGIGLTQQQQEEQQQQHQLLDPMNGILNLGVARSGPTAPALQGVEHRAQHAAMSSFDWLGSLNPDCSRISSWPAVPGANDLGVEMRNFVDESNRAVSSGVKSRAGKVVVRSGVWELEKCILYGELANRATR